MDIGSATSSSLFPSRATALGGLQDAQARVAEASEQLAGGNLDPAVVVAAMSAQTDFVANAKLLKADQENTTRLLDMLA